MDGSVVPRAVMRCGARKENEEEGKKKRRLEVETKTKESQGSVGERPQAESDERRRAGSCAVVELGIGRDSSGGDKGRGRA